MKDYLFLLVAAEAIEVSEATWTRANYQQDRVQHSGVVLGISGAVWLGWARPCLPLASSQDQLHKEEHKSKPKMKQCLGEY